MALPNDGVFGLIAWNLCPDHDAMRYALVLSIGKLGRSISDLMGAVT